MATMTQAPPPRIRTTITKETLPGLESSPTDAKVGQFYDREWELVVNSLTKAEWAEHIMRIYRSNEKWERGPGPVENTFSGPFTEEDVRNRFGGGRYVLWLYGPPKKQTLVGRYNLELEGQPIINSIPRTSGSSTEGTLELLVRELLSEIRVSRGGNLAQDSMRQAMALNAEALRTGVDAARSVAPPAAPQDDEFKSMMKDFMRAMIGRMLDPPQTNSVKDTIALVTEIKNAGFFGTTSGKTDMTSTIVASIPMLMDRFVGGLHEYRLKTESDERVIRLQRGEMRPTDSNTITMDPQAPASTQPPPANPRPAPVTNVSQVTPEIAQAIIAQAHLHRIVNGIKQPNSTAQDMYDYFLNAWPEMLDELVKFNSETLLAFFKSREAQIQFFGNDILAQVGDDPRLPKMLDEFLAIAKKEHEPAAATAGVV